MKLKFTTVIKLVLAKVIQCFEILNWNYLTFVYFQWSGLFERTMQSELSFNH